MENMKMKNDEYINNSRPVDIEEFINKFKCCNNKLNEYNVETIETLFVDGYCYHFAKILKHVFPSGELYLAWPCSHIVFGINGKYYDINGEYTKFDPKFPFRRYPIPFRLFNIPNFIMLERSFLHARDKDYPVSITELLDMYLINVRLKNLNRIKSIKIKSWVNNVIDEVINESIDFILMHFDEESINDEIAPISLKDFVSKYFERLRIKTD